LLSDVLSRLVGQMLACLVTNYHLGIDTQESYLAAQTSWPGLAS
jgi:hypothetical protein